MAEYERKLRDVLKSHGCVFTRRGKGDHDIWYSPILTDLHTNQDSWQV